MMPSLRLTNTLTRTKEVFAPIDPAHVRLYACGPTVYDLAHIGNARPVIVFDLLFRLLRHMAEAGAFDGGRGETRVSYVRNITDVDDKINARAVRDFPDLPLNEAIRQVTEGTERQFHEDIRALGATMPDDLADTRHRMIEPRATEHIDEMRTLIDRLIESGHAYAAQGHVLFHVPSMPDYGQLSKRPLEELEAGARIDVAPYKRSPYDFVLWKPSGPEEPGWPSPAGLPGLGRPGWHIECSAMSWRHLGETFDIHAGGLDLIFPHHENEIAQSRCCFGTPVMANVWLHNGFLQVEGEKMSKSLGNFVTIRDLLKTDLFGSEVWYGPVVRLAMLQTEYRKPIDWTVGRLKESSVALTSFVSAAQQRDRDDGRPSDTFLEALCDDLNTPAAITELHRLAHRVRRPQDESSRLISANHIYAALKILGLGAANPIRFALEKAEQITIDRERVSELIAQRLDARAARNWAESDRIRDELKALGVQLKDNKDGTTTWEAAR